MSLQYNNYSEACGILTLIFGTQHIIQNLYRPMLETWVLAHSRDWFVLKDNNSWFSTQLY